MSIIKASDIRLKVRPVLLGLEHKYFYEGPCRFGQGEALQPGFDKFANEDLFNMFLSQLFRQTLADITGASIELLDTDGALGAAKAAGIGAGIYRDHGEAFASLERIAVVEPSASPVLDEAYLRWKDELLKVLRQ